jgi:glycerophosphoryl diester phosphodiesterase
MSFSWTALQRVEKLAPALPLVMLVERAHHWQMLRHVIGDDWLVGPDIDELRRHPGFARKLAESGHDLHVWTVNSEAELEVCLELGVQAVISDRPAYMLELMRG